jgi:hypothetical protein
MNRDITISELPATTVADDNSYIPIDNGDITYRIKVSDYNAGANGTARTYAESASNYANAAAESASSAAASLESCLRQEELADSNARAAYNYANNAQTHANTAYEYAAAASTSASNATSQAQQVSDYAREAGEKSEDAEAFAVGQRKGVDVTSEDETFENNAKYYKEQASAEVARISDLTANVSSNALKAEGYAVGTQDGSPILSDYSQNNAKYYAENAASSAHIARVSKDTAVQYAKKAESAVVKAPYIGDNNHWYVYNFDQEKYIDTNVGATGDPGTPGQKGDAGITPTITATASVDNTSGTPSVTVQKSGSNTNPSFAFSFSGLKGQPGDGSGTSYDDTEIKSEINDTWKAQGELGAKNLLPYPYAQKSWTKAGITYIVDDKGRISTSGISTGNTDFSLSQHCLLEMGDYIISDGCPNKAGQYLVVWYKHDSVTDTLATVKFDTFARFSITQEQADAMKNGEAFIVIRLASDGSGKDWNNLTFYPMLRLASDTDDTWQPYTLTNYELDNRITNEVNNIYQLQGELGAKNLLKYPYYDTSKAMGGITFTVNDDGSVTMNGTSTSSSYPSFLYALRNYNLKAGDYFITCEEELPIGIRLDVGEANTLDAPTITNNYTSLSLAEHEKSFTVPANAQNFGVRIQFNPNVTVSNLTLHVMIRSAVDTDNTWKPYAPTNYNLNEKIEDLKDSLNTSSIMGITCWGDSLTAMGGWTQKLQELSGIPVYNGGTGSEDSKCIMARQGGDVMIVDGITIPATATAVTIASRATDSGISTELGNKVTPLFQTSAHVNPVMLGDIKGTLAWTGSSGEDQNGTWTFTRTTAGEEIVIDRPTAIKTNFDIVHNGKNELMIIYMGANGGWNDIADLVHQHKLMIDHFKGKEYVVLGLSSGTAASRADYEAAMKEAFGRRFISLREYLAHPIYENGEIVSCYGLADQNLTPSTKEYAGVTYNSLDEIATGTVPHQLLIDGIHYTEGTRQVIGKMLYRRLKELNIL